MATYVVDGRNVAGFGIRLGAYILDGIILFVVQWIILFILGVAWSGSRGEIIPSGLVIVLIIGFLFLYRPICWTAWGTTPGKRMLGLQIVSEDGGRLNFGKAFVRFLGYFISELLFFLGFIWIAIDKRNQGWHDKIAGTFVVSSSNVLDVRAGPREADGRFGDRPVGPASKDSVSQAGNPGDSRALVAVKATLLVVEGSEVGRKYQVRRTPVTIGRSKGDDMQLEGDSHISRAQIVLVSENDVWTIEDHGAKNPLQVNGNVVRSATLRSHDRIKLGKTVIEFQVN